MKGNSIATYEEIVSEMNISHTLAATRFFPRVSFSLARARPVRSFGLYAIGSKTSHLRRKSPVFLDFFMVFFSNRMLTS
jgi:hypothetical protein